MGNKYSDQVQLSTAPHCVRSGSAILFRKTRSHLRIIDAERVTRRQFQTDGPQTLGAALQTLTFVLGILLLCTDLQFATYSLDTTNCIMLYNKYVTTCFDQLRGHPQATRAHKLKTATENVILCQNEQSFCYRVHAGTISM